MPRRALAWLLTLPLVAAGVLGGHMLAYALTGKPLGPEHDYLAHAVQLMLVLATVGVVGLSVQQRDRRSSSGPYVLVAALAFACQEHVERLAHGGSAVLLTEPTFLLGLLLQAPVALACLALARWLLRSAASGTPTRPPRLADLVLPLTVVPPRRSMGVAVVSHRGRSPPTLLHR